MQQMHLIFASEQYLIFLQALSDNIVELKTIIFSCDCLKVNIGAQKKVNDLELGYGLVQQMITKYRRIIRTKIFYQRFLIWKYKKQRKLFVKNLLGYSKNPLLKKDLFFFLKTGKSK